MIFFPVLFFFFCINQKILTFIYSLFVRIFLIFCNVFFYDFINKINLNMRMQFLFKSKIKVKNKLNYTDNI